MLQSGTGFFRVLQSGSLIILLEDFIWKPLLSTSLPLQICFVLASFINICPIGIFRIDSNFANSIC